MNKEQYQGRLSSTTTALPPSPGGVNIEVIKITSPAKYILTVGFEVNYPDAFTDNIQDLSVDYGHAFFYITKDDVVTVFFSFGPKGLGEGGKKTDAYNGKRPGNTSYLVGEVAKLFRLTITEKQAVDVKKAADTFTAKVNAGKEFYDASLNDTCAETARDILAEGGVDTPNGNGAVKGMGYDGLTKWMSVVNPYMWHKNFLDKYNTEITYYGPSGKESLNGEVKIDPEWLLDVGDFDPLISTGQAATVQGNAAPQSKKSSQQPSLQGAEV